jgi:hypothetical protein
MLSYLDEMMKTSKDAGAISSDYKAQAQQTNQDYRSLYSCKYFRNRTIRLQNMLNQLDIDAIVLILGKYSRQILNHFIGCDSKYDVEMNRLQNWLLFG